jgi:site-specific recombinase XerC
VREIQIKKVTHHGKERWQVIEPAEVSGTGKRKRRFLPTEEEARKLVDRINRDRGSIQELFHRLDSKSQETVLRCLHRVDGDASQIEQALDAWLKRRHVESTVTLEQLRRECLDSKQKANKRQSYIANLTNSLKTFVDPRSSTLVSDIQPAEIETWLHGNGWATATKQGVLKDVRTLFSFAVKRKYLHDNPALRVDRPEDDEEGPVKILVVEQARLMMARARASDPPLARWLAVQLFGGLRKSEAKRLTEADILKEAVFVSALTKTRTKRYVPINPTLRAWLSLAGKLPLKNIVRRLRRVRGELRKVQSKRGVRMKHVIDVPYPRNCLRHSFCSYALAYFEDAAKVALWAGHKEEVLFAKYREAVTESSAREFWAIAPTPPSTRQG